MSLNIESSLFSPMQLSKKGPIPVFHDFKSKPIGTPLQDLIGDNTDLHQVSDTGSGIVNQLLDILYSGLVRVQR